LLLEFTGGCDFKGVGKYTGYIFLSLAERQTLWNKTFRSFGSSARFFRSNSGTNLGSHPQTQQSSSKFFCYKASLHRTRIKIHFINSYKNNKVKFKAKRTCSSSTRGHDHSLSSWSRQPLQKSTSCAKQPSSSAQFRSSSPCAWSLWQVSKTPAQARIKATCTTLQTAHIITTTPNSLSTWTFTALSSFHLTRWQRTTGLVALSNGWLKHNSIVRGQNASNCSGKKKTCNNVL
jgi:hypothetical protein